MDENKVFLLNRGEIEGRFDPIFYADRSKYDGFISLGKYIDVKGGKRIPLGKTYSETPTDYQYLRVDNMDADGEIDFENLKFIDEDVFKTLERYELRENDLIISIAGTIGKVSLFKSSPSGKRVILTENCAKILIKSPDVNSDFLKIIFQTEFIQAQLRKNYIQTTIPKLGLERIYKLLVPLFPSLEKQAEIVALLQAAYAAKTDRDRAAAALLSATDDYLLSALGIALPAAGGGGLEERVFFRQMSEVAGGRMDPEYHRTEYQQLLEELLKVPNRRLHEISNFSRETWNQTDYHKEIFPYIEISEIELEHGIVKNVAQIPVNEAPSRARMLVRSGDLIVSTTRPGRGATALIDDSMHLHIASTGFAVLRNFAGTTPEFLHTVLRSKICLKQMEQRSSGGNYPAITIAELGRVVIPVPPPAIQSEIAQRVEQMRQEAFGLKADGERLLAAARQEVERLILGGG